MKSLAKIFIMGLSSTGKTILAKKLVTSNIE